MANLSFDTPKTATIKQYEISGTVPANSTVDQAVQMLVTRADNSTQGYYVSLPSHYNSSTTVGLAVTDTVLMPIIPQLTGTDSSTAYLGQDLEGWIIQE